MTNENEDLIEATIRRVQEAKAARAGNADSAPQEPGGHSTEPGAPAAAHEAAEASVEASVEESVIEATIRRVAAAKAARTGSDDPMHEPSAPENTAEAAYPPPLIATLADRPPWPAGPAPADDPVAVAPTIPPEAAERPSSEGHSRDDDGGWQLAVARLERELRETQRELAELAARVESGAIASPPSSRAAVEDDDWDETPQLPRIPIAQPRPAIFRDPSPATATAAHFVEVEDETVIDTRPIPAPLPPLHAEKRGLDLLPRTYRITVEDKRRGVDLVPLHRALLGMEGVRDMSLLSFANGVAIVALETIEELNPQSLEQSVARAMSCPARVEVHNEQTMVVKLAED